MKIIGKSLSALLLAALSAVSLSEMSPVYDFAPAKPFEGPDIYNPYASFNPEYGWKRANFHTHTRVSGILNECPEWPDRVYDDYLKAGYDILTFSNHNELTPHPYDTSLQVNVYEHGYNLLKFHKLVFNPSRMILHDVMIPFSASQRQFELDYLSRNADFLVLNHPGRTGCTTARIMASLTGYRLIETGRWSDDEGRHWDEALSAGHYSFCIANDDCHDSGDTTRIAVRCSWQNAPSGRYDDIKRSLLGGCHYSMTTGGYSAALPSLVHVGMSGDTISVAFDGAASGIMAIGQGHTVLDRVTDTAEFHYRFKPQDTYVRIVAQFEGGAEIYFNPFARYDKTKAETPYEESPHRVNIPLTVLFNAVVLALAFAALRAAAALLAHKKRKS